MVAVDVNEVEVLVGKGTDDLRRECPVYLYGTAADRLVELSDDRLVAAIPLLVGRVVGVLQLVGHILESPGIDQVELPWVQSLEHVVSEVALGSADFCGHPLLRKAIQYVDSACVD